jgi:threonine dehydratase
VGLQIPEGEEADLERFLRDLDYPWVDESSNPVYRLFLR